MLQRSHINFLELQAVFRSSVTKGPSCPGTDGQCHHGGLYQLAGGLALLSGDMSGGQSWKIRSRLGRPVKSTEMFQSPPFLHPWDWPDKTWSHIHVDYAGPFMGMMFFVLIDAHSKWMDVYPVNSATSAMTIECLRTSFSNHGLPELLVSDNALVLLAESLRNF